MNESLSINKNTQSHLFILNDGFEVRDFSWRKYIVVLKEGGDPISTRLPNTFVFKNSYCHYCLQTGKFVIRNLISWI